MNEFLLLPLAQAAAAATEAAAAAVSLPWWRTGYGAWGVALASRGESDVSLRPAADPSPRFPLERRR